MPNAGQRPDFIANLIREEGLHARACMGRRLTLGPSPSIAHPTIWVTRLVAIAVS